MTETKLIPLVRICELYEIEEVFLTEIHEVGLLDFVEDSNEAYVHEDRLDDLEKIIRIHRELKINTEGIDAVFNLLHQIDELRNELNAVRNRLRLYEDEQMS